MIEALGYLRGNGGEGINPADDLSRFLYAQEDRFSGYDVAFKEVERGKKVSHWIWYIFPQLRGLGCSRRSAYYGISGRQEAEEYLQHPVLGERLRAITRILLEHEGARAEKIFGGVDAMKVQSCMTLFDSVSPDDIFARVLDVFYGGERDAKSIV